jgi:hypothetical protein
MPLFRNAFYWFIALLVVSILGFWKSYLSQLGSDDLHITHHLHAASMLIWVALLITQSWLMRVRNITRHRTLGRTAFFVAPAIVVSGIWVNLHFLEGLEAPFADGLISIYWFGWFLPIAFAVLFIMAMVHRKQMQLHARYMAATAFVFLIPGLGRALGNYVEPLTGWVPDFPQLMALILVANLWLLYRDWRQEANLQPYLVSSGLWAVNQLLWAVSPSIPFWRDFTAWSVALVS